MRAIVDKLNRHGYAWTHCNAAWLLKFPSDVVLSYPWIVMDQLTVTEGKVSWIFILYTIQNIVIAGDHHMIWVIQCICNVRTVLVYMTVPIGLVWSDLWCCVVFDRICPCNVCMYVWCMCAIRQSIHNSKGILSNNQACGLSFYEATYLIAPCPAAWLMRWDRRHRWSNIPTVKRSMSYQNKRWLFSARKMHVLNNILHALIGPLQLHAFRTRCMLE